jgi:hypothetical protein
VRGALCGVRSAWCVVRSAWCGVRGALCVVRGAGCVVRGASGIVRKIGRFRNVAVTDERRTAELAKVDVEHGVTHDAEHLGNATRSFDLL